MLPEARERAILITDVQTQVHLDLTATDAFLVEATISFGCTRPGATQLPRAARGHGRDPRRVAGGVRRRAYRAARPRGHQHRPGHGADALRHRRRRDDRDDRPGRRRALRLRLHGDGHRPEGHPLLRPARHQDDVHGVGDRPLPLDRPRQRRARRPGGRHVVLRDDAADLLLPLLRRRRSVGVGDVGRALRPGARRHAALRLARARLAGARAAPRRRRAPADHECLLPALHDDLRAALRLRRLPAALLPRAQLGCDGVPRLRGLPRRGADPGHAHRARAGVDRLDHRPRDGAHVVRRPGDDGVVGGLLAQRVLRRLHGLRRRGRRPRATPTPGPPPRSPASPAATAPIAAARPTRSPRTPRRSSTSTPPSPTST